jgi:hypothetical protein
MIDARRGEALALCEGAKVEGLGGVLDGHLKRQIQAPIVNTQFVSSIEEIEIKLHFLNIDGAFNGGKTFGHLISFRQIRFAGSFFCN